MVSNKALLGINNARLPPDHLNGIAEAANRPPPLSQPKSPVNVKAALSQENFSPGLSVVLHPRCCHPWWKRVRLGTSPVVSVAQARSYSR